MNLFPYDLICYDPVILVTLLNTSENVALDSFSDIFQI